MINNLSISKDTVSLCYKNSCIHAKGSNANLIAVGAFAITAYRHICIITIKLKRFGVKRPNFKQKTFN